MPVPGGLEWWPRHQEKPWTGGQESRALLLVSASSPLFEQTWKCLSLVYRDPSTGKYFTSGDRELPREWLGLYF